MVFAEEMPSISKFVENEKLEKVDSFLTTYNNDTNSTIYIEIPESGGSDLYYQSFLTSGLDRGTWPIPEASMLLIEESSAKAAS
jgi:hypothetical protein